MEVEFGQSTDPGLDPAKRINEDACGYAETKFGHLFVICDGMGGHAGGREASDIAIRTIFDHMANAQEGADPGRTLSRAIEEAGRRVYEFGGPASNTQRPGTTCVSILMHGGSIDVAHVGDSRAYAIRGKQIYRLTRDHSMVQELLDGGVISEHDAMGHPDSNKITRALGMTPEVLVELREEPMEVYEGDVFVLASDGLTDLARNDDILVTVNEYLKSKDVQAVCDELVALANRRGGHDNITVQVIRVLKANQPGVTRVQEPPPLAGQRVAATIDEGSRTPPPPGASRTVPQGPLQPGGPLQPHDLLHDAHDTPRPGMPTHGLATTAPDQPLPTLIEQHHMPVPFPAPIPSQRDPKTQTLTYVVLGMAGVIGLLLALLLWALYFRG